MYGLSSEDATALPRARPHPLALYTTKRAQRVEEIPPGGEAGQNPTPVGMRLERIGVYTAAAQARSRMWRSLAV